MLLFGVLENDTIATDSVTETVDDDWWWYVTYLGLVVVGIFAQVSATDRLRGSVREAWSSGPSGRG
jgi:hypothetical protein